MFDSLLTLVVATLCGAAVGVERQWSGHATGPDARFGGVRTFTLIGVAGGMAGGLWVWGGPALALALGVVALVVR
ncbi:MAG: MgtC/SapB family protein [Acidobacteria bacterium]|nr:MgtC/SapB family protein [Acidobacteriota bacterium]